MLNRLKEAIECYEKIVAIIPKDADAWNSRGVLLLQLEMIEERFECLRHCISLGMDVLERKFSRDDTFLSLDQYKTAAEKLDNVIKIHSKQGQLRRSAESAKKHIVKIMALIEQQYGV